MELIKVLSTGLVLFVLSILTRTIYLIYLHPLSQIPGPTLWKTSRIPFALALRSGYFALRVKGLHARYGPIVRIAPDEVSFINEEAWFSIYSPQKGHVFPKSPVWYHPRPNGSYGIMAAPNTEHSRFRRTFAPAFAEKAVREQEPLIQKHIEILIEKLKKETINKEPINILKWFEYLTFDIVGDLCFSNSFGCLESNENHIQIDTLQNAMKYFTLAVVPRVLGLEVAKKFVVPAITRKKHLTYYKSLNDWTHQRFDEGENPAKNDLMTYVYRYLQTEKKGLSLIETENAFGDFMIAGSETVATTLAAAFFHLTRHPDILQQLNQELLSAVKQESGITLSVVSELPFLNAVIMESMRLCPSLPTAMPRIVPPSGSTICGHYIPSGIYVTFSQLAAYTSDSNFSSPEEFIPSRWLPSSKMEVHNINVFHPFSIGPRSCIGKLFGLLEVKLIVSRLLVEFQIQGVHKWDWNEQRAYFIWEKRPLLVEMTPRILSNV